MLCENCGAELQISNQAFCPNCGNPLKLKELIQFNHGNTLLFIDSQNRMIWIWVGSKATVRMKFIAIKRAQSIRDRDHNEFDIVIVDEGQEPSLFKQFLEKNNPDVKKGANSL